MQLEDIKPGMYVKATSSIGKNDSGKQKFSIWYGQIVGPYIDDDGITHRDRVRLIWLDENYVRGTYGLNDGSRITYYMPSDLEPMDETEVALLVIASL